MDPHNRIHTAQKRQSELGEVAPKGGMRQVQKSYDWTSVDAAQLMISSRALPRLTGQLADKPTRGQSSRGLDNSRTGQLADSDSEYF